MYVCMYVCMYVWMDGWMYVCMDEHVCMYACMHVCMRKWIDGRMDGRMGGPRRNGRMDGPTDGRTDGRTDGCVDACMRARSRGCACMPSRCVGLASRPVLFAYVLEAWELHDKPGLCRVIGQDRAVCCSICFYVDELDDGIDESRALHRAGRLSHRVEFHQRAAGCYHLQPAR